MFTIINPCISLTTPAICSPLAIAAAGCLLWQEQIGWLTRCTTIQRQQLQQCFAAQACDWQGLEQNDPTSLHVPTAYQQASGWLLVDCGWQTLYPLFSRNPRPFGQVRIATLHPDWFTNQTRLTYILSQIDIVLCGTHQLQQTLRDPRLGLWAAIERLCRLGAKQIGLLTETLAFYGYQSTKELAWHIPATPDNSPHTNTLTLALAAAGFIGAFCANFDPLQASCFAVATASLQPDADNATQVLQTYPALLSARAQRLQQLVTLVNV